MITLFENVIADKDIVDELKDQVKNSRISGCYIFESEADFSVKSLVMDFARLLLNLSDKESLELCSDFKNIGGGGKNIKKESVEMLIRDSRIKPYMRDRKVYIIEDADFLTIESQNALLKTLEEAPSFLSIIMTLKNRNSLRDTVLSRAKIYRMQNLSFEEIKIFKEKFYKDISDDYVHFCDGNIDLFKRYLEDDNLIRIRREMPGYMKRLMTSDKTVLIDFYQFLDENKDYKDFIYLIMKSITREIIQKKPHVVNVDFFRITKAHEIKKDLKSLIKIIKDIEKAQYEIENNGNFKIINENLLLNILNSGD